jgi:hypothetical protein
MTVDALKSLAGYSQFVAEQLSVAGVVSSTISVWSASPYTGIAEGDILFSNGFRLRLREELDFDAGLITSYGYEVYNVEERLYWYDDFPHPDEPTLATTHPHHKHVPPDIKHNRIPAPEMSFTRPNLPALIREIEGLIA